MTYHKEDFLAALARLRERDKETTTSTTTKQRLFRRDMPIVEEALLIAANMSEPQGASR